MDENKPIIFISHAAADHARLEPLVDFLQKIYDLPNASGSIMYTSRPETGLSNDSRFNDKLRQALQKCKLVIILLTSQYVNRPYCLYELGAIWALNKKSFFFNPDKIKKSDIPDIKQGHVYSEIDSSSLGELIDTLDTLDVPKRETKQKTITASIFATIQRIKNHEAQEVASDVQGMEGTPNTKAKVEQDSSKQARNDSLQQNASPNSSIDELDDSDIRNILIVIRGMSAVESKKGQVDREVLNNALEQAKWEYTTIRYTLKLCKDNGLIEESGESYKLTDQGCAFYKKKKFMLNQPQTMPDVGLHSIGLTPPAYPDPWHQSVQPLNFDTVQPAPAQSYFDCSGQLPLCPPCYRAGAQSSQPNPRT